MKRETLTRFGFYIAGLLILALGLISNTKADLGVSPIISVSYSAATIWNFNFGNAVFVQYSIFVAAELLLHALLYLRQRRVGKKGSLNLKRVFLMDILQLLLSLIFTRFMNLFSLYLPDFSGSALTERILVLLIAIALTGIGAAMSLNMRLVPNPGDGIVQTISDFAGKKVGFIKNCFDAFNIAAAILVGLACTGTLVGVGLGTVCAVIGVGRVIALFNHIFGKQLLSLSGLPQPNP